MDFKGVLIEESLTDKSVLKELKILNTKKETVTEKHRTPWLKQWTLLSIEIPEEKIDEISEKIRLSLDKDHEWYLDLKNNKYELTIFHNEVIKRRIFGYFK